MLTPPPFASRKESTYIYIYIAACGLYMINSNPGIISPLSLALMTRVKSHFKYDGDQYIRQPLNQAMEVDMLVKISFVKTGLYNSALLYLTCSNNNYEVLEKCSVY
jgi:hypothetical protein